MTRYPTTDQPFHVALAALRHERGLTFRALARLTRLADGDPPPGKGLSWQHLRRLELELDLPTPAVISTVARTFALRPAYFAEYRLAVLRSSLDERTVGVQAALEAARRLGAATVEDGDLPPLAAAAASRRHRAA